LKTQLKIALDYDDCYTECPKSFSELVRVFQKQGHEVKMVTWRTPDNTVDIEEAAEFLGVDVIYCSGKAKMKCYAADIWIDDSPYAVVCHAKWAKIYKD
jgi:hypothetical protein